MFGGLKTPSKFTTFLALPQHTADARARARVRRLADLHRFSTSGPKSFGVGPGNGFMIFNGQVG